MARANKVDELLFSMQGDVFICRIWYGIAVVGHPGLAIA
jgi:hypothetical protein